MDAEDFKTLGECEFGTIWEVQSENKVVVNAYQAALYFSREDFMHFAKMVEESVVALTGRGFQASSAPPPAAPAAAPAAKKEAQSEVAQITDFRAFRKSKGSSAKDEEDDDFTS
ncbi:hypothetical protein COW36_12275 [bacterium (Candidatus Blackallbacteria) CG17_big_fil_post_rev_8_21_14_2_50_48_46]|uniref:Uncharacterized protein n=1 Tax=bacterium (Candidatus Blackallbacteria) CG17_big_fil_post_rev_8_21_14_2_50_48_46 TaxID=2014261 RepID=A0A2M7G3T2_9BACT|nr:MAG: hypothetical protein COW64_02985 [bacterium (Candidatus Blackallbacteria) CG18_big_fil_WC_8_21_14_2_50_49_26]PIW16536.1 MAG: hypothetical protein COW36_12275 [bacterium (Candidatus Blackallbacteria) CG17_big_fil_post_rev_8_21_14_2_50_48_46]PIW46044.1 MAG: hypothetical protein COW20_17540 [bacterium (Candidatus Blackallbacteria) CG13_big_fil_rev_8_21_14_2_50_49_14]